jgi:hypothetical protein
MKWNNLEDCDYPICDADEAVPVCVVSNNKVVEAWYRNPETDICWFESDSGKEIKANLWIETLSVVDKPQLPILK